MGHDEIPRDRIQLRAERIMRRQRQRDARFTEALTWSSIVTGTGTVLVLLLLATGLVSTEVLVMAPAVLNLAQGALVGLLRRHDIE